MIITFSFKMKMIVREKKKKRKINKIRKTRSRLVENFKTYKVKEEIVRVDTDRRTVTKKLRNSWTE